MLTFVGESNAYKKEHKQKLRVPNDEGEGAEGLPEIIADGTLKLYLRCQDANGNANEADVVFSFCIDPAPYTKPPIIEGTSIQSGQPVQYNVDKVPIEV